MSADLKYVLVVDAEATGLDTTHDDILEFAAILADTDLNELGSIERVVSPSQGALARMNDDSFVMSMHEQSGLLEALAAPDVVTPGALDLIVMAWLAELGVSDESLLLAGSGVARFDRPLIDRQLPRLASQLLYYELDVSTLRRSWRLFTGADLTDANTKKPHRAMADARLHLEEARVFRRTWRRHMGFGNDS